MSAAHAAQITPINPTDACNDIDSSPLRMSIHCSQTTETAVSNVPANAHAHDTYSAFHCYPGYYQKRIKLPLCEHVSLEEANYYATVSSISELQRGITLKFFETSHDPWECTYSSGVTEVRHGPNGEIRIVAWPLGTDSSDEWGSILVIKDSEVERWYNEAEEEEREWWADMETETEDEAEVEAEGEGVGKDEGEEELKSE